MSDAQSASADRVNRALTGDLPVEDLTATESKIFDTEVDRRLSASMAGDDLTVPENQSNEPVGGMSIGPDGEIVLIAPDGSTFLGGSRLAAAMEALAPSLTEEQIRQRLEEVEQGRD